MPEGKYRTVVVTVEAYALAEKLVQSGLERSISKAFSNAMKEYAKRRENLVRGIQTVKQKWSADEG